MNLEVVLIWEIWDELGLPREAPTAVRALDRCILEGSKRRPEVPWNKRLRLWIRGRAHPLFYWSQMRKEWTHTYSKGRHTPAHKALVCLGSPISTTKILVGSATMSVTSVKPRWNGLSQIPSLVEAVRIVLARPVSDILPLPPRSGRDSRVVGTHQHSKLHSLPHDTQFSRVVQS